MIRIEDYTVYIGRAFTPKQGDSLRHWVSAFCLYIGTLKPKTTGIYIRKTFQWGRGTDLYL
jgi:hypothetical protein